jgi:hypothetical protein
VGEAAALSRDLADFLIELSIALHKNAIYPPGHPLLKNTVGGVTRRLSALLQDRATLSLGVARHQLVIEGVATDPNHPLLRELAQRLHRHHLGAVRFMQGIEPDEVADVLRTVAGGTRDETPLGLGPAENLTSWKKVRLYRLTYDHLELLDESNAPPPEGDAQREQRGGRGAQLWVGLARAALAAESMQTADAAAAAVPPPEPSTDPVMVAKAIDEHGKDVAYDQVIVGYLLQIAEELKAKRGTEGVALQRRISKLVSSMQPQTLRRLLDMGGDFRQRRRFLLDASQGMAVDAVMEVVRAAAESSNQTISGSLMRLLSKLAVHAEGGATAPTREHADTALRDHVQKLIGNWELDDPNPGAYGSVLEGMSKAAPIFVTSEEMTNPAEPERILKMSLEVGVLGDTGVEAIDEMIKRGRTSGLLDLIDEAPADSKVATMMWQQLLSHRPLRAAFDAEKPDFRLIERMASRAQLGAASPLLDALESGDDKPWVPKVLDLLVSLGPETAPLAIDRLPLVRWSVQRQLLILLGRLGPLPETFSLEEFVRHPEAKVRREALRLIMARPETRERGVLLCLVDLDESILRIGLAAALDACPKTAIPLLTNRVSDTTADPQIRALALKVLASTRAPEALEIALEMASAPRKMLRGRRLAPKSVEMLAALSALATHWPKEPRAQSVVALAKKHRDPEVQAIAVPGGRSR